MTPSINLEGMGLRPLTKNECKQVSGGWWLPQALVIGIVLSALNNFQDIREGLMDGYNGTPRYQTKPFLGHLMQ